MKGAWLKSTALTATIVATGYATLVGLAAWDHNPQGEFHDWETGAIQWVNFAPLIGMSFAIPFVLVSLAGVALWAAFALTIKLVS